MNETIAESCDLSTRAPVGITLQLPVVFPAFTT
jgi:hypothetical protein